MVSGEIGEWQQGWESDGEADYERPCNQDKGFTF